MVHADATDANGVHGPELTATFAGARDRQHGPVGHDLQGPCSAPACPVHQCIGAGEPGVGLSLSSMRTNWPVRLSQSHGSSGAYRGLGWKAGPRRRETPVVRAELQAAGLLHLRGGSAAANATAWCTHQHSIASHHRCYARPNVFFSSVVSWRVLWVLASSSVCWVVPQVSHCCVRTVPSSCVVSRCRPSGLNVTVSVEAW